MGERPGIFRELRGPQHAHILNPLHRRRPLIGREALIAKHGEAFFQAQLKPIPAGDAIARPIVEIFMRNHSGHGIIIKVGRGIGIGQYVARVKDIEALIFHRAKVKIGNGHDVKLTQIIFATIDIFVPAHAGL